MVQNQYRNFNLWTYHLLKNLAATRLIQSPAVDSVGFLVKACPAALANPYCLHSHLVLSLRVGRQAGKAPHFAPPPRCWNARGQRPLHPRRRRTGAGSPAARGQAAAAGGLCGAGGFPCLPALVPCSRSVYVIMGRLARAAGQALVGCVTSVNLPKCHIFTNVIANCKPYIGSPPP